MKTPNGTDIYNAFGREMTPTETPAIAGIEIQSMSDDELVLAVRGQTMRFNQRAVITFDLPLVEDSRNSLKLRITRSEGNDIEKGLWVTTHVLNTTFRVSSFQPDQSVLQLAHDLMEFLNAFFDSYELPVTIRFGDH
ncbi:hypothetical protein D3C71_77740 [compost metagenome]